MKIGKYLFPNLKQAKEMQELTTSTENNPTKNTCYGLKPEIIKSAEYSKEGEIIQEAETSGKWQLDVVWYDTENIDPEVVSSYLVDIKGQGNSRISGINYQEHKLK